MYTKLNGMGIMTQVHPHEIQFTAFSSEPPLPVLVETTDDEDKATHWGWVVGDDISLVQPSLLQLNMCFPGDPIILEQSGKGLRRPLILTLVDQ